MITETTAPKNLNTIHDVYTAWLDLPHSSPTKAKAELKNRDRGITDRQNHVRALRCLAVATTRSTDDLALCPADALDVSDTLLEARVEGGAEILAARQEKAAPSRKTMRNARSHAGTRRQAIVHYDDRAPGEVWKRFLAAVKCFSTSKFTRLALYDSADAMLRQVQSSYQLVVQHPAPAGSDRPHRQFLVSWDTQLTDQQHV